MFHPTEALLATRIRKQSMDPIKETRTPLAHLRTRSLTATRSCQLRKGTGLTCPTSLAALCVIHLLLSACLQTMSALEARKPCHVRSRNWAQLMLRPACLTKPGAFSRGSLRMARNIVGHGKKRVELKDIIDDAFDYVNCGQKGPGNSEWWHMLAEFSTVTQAKGREASLANKFVSLKHVVSVEVLANVVQHNCIVSRCKLQLQGRENKRQDYYVAVKLIDLDRNKYRSSAHKQRSSESYQVERCFYEKYSMHVRDSGLRVPLCLTSAWQEPECSHGVVLLEDLSIHPEGGASMQQRKGTARSEVIPVAAIERPTSQRVALNKAESEAALQWLATFHALHWTRPKLDVLEAGMLRSSASSAANDSANAPARHGGLWHSGGYWTLDKRESDLPRMDSEWQRWLQVVGQAHGCAAEHESVQQLGARLARCARTIDATIQEQRASTGETLLHGDFKTANCFFHCKTGQPASYKSHVLANAKDSSVSARGLSVGVCDFQWCGRGLGVADAVYLLYTSVDPHCVETQGDLLLKGYIADFQARLLCSGVVDVPSEVQLLQQSRVRSLEPAFLHCRASSAVVTCAATEVQGELDVHLVLLSAHIMSALHVQCVAHKECVGYVQLVFLDYVRFLIGSMWGSCTIHSFKAKAESINEGMHKRDMHHQWGMIRRAVSILEEPDIWLGPLACSVKNRYNSAEQVHQKEKK